MIHPITPATLANYNKLTVKLSRKPVEEFRRHNLVPEKIINRQNEKSVEVKAADGVPDSELDDSIEMIPKIIIERMVLQPTARGKTVKSKLNAVNSKKSTLAKKKKPTKHARPKFVLPPVPKRKKHSRSITQTA